MISCGALNAWLKWLGMDDSLAVHCRASIGRSSVLAVSVVVRLGGEANEAFIAVKSARGCSIPDTPEQRQWVIQNISATR